MDEFDDDANIEFRNEEALKQSQRFLEQILAAKGDRLEAVIHKVFMN